MPLWPPYNNTIIASPVSSTDFLSADWAKLKLISCACKKGCNTGSCMKHGLKCTISCKKCKGTSCSNCENIGHSSDWADT